MSLPVYPTLSKNPAYPLDPDGELEDVVIRSDLTAGYQQTRPRSTRARPNFGLTYPSLPDVDVALLRAFEQTTLVNGASPFTWTHPITSVSYTVGLSVPIKYARVVPQATKVSIKLQVT